jgi:NhaP-type Na+/H+ or K+/H+ antiporter
MFKGAWRFVAPVCRDPTLTTVVTLLSAYASYYCADGLVGASGLLAVVCNGFTMSLIGVSVTRHDNVNDRYSCVRDKVQCGAGSSVPPEGALLTFSRSVGLD